MEKVAAVLTIKILDVDDKEFVLKELKKLYDTVRKEEKGWIQYEYYQDISDENSIVFVETWESAQALEKHMQSSHIIEVINNTAGKIEFSSLQKLKQITK